MNKIKIFPKQRHKYLILFLLGIVFVFLVSRFNVTRQFLISIGEWGYPGAFVAGALYIFTFTTATGLVVIAELSAKLNPLIVGLVGGAGAVFGDLLIFFLARKKIEKEVRYYIQRAGGNFLLRLLQRKPLRWVLPVIGAVIIASPFPDEIGVSLMGFSKISVKKFIILSYVLNSSGIFLISLASGLFV